MYILHKYLCIHINTNICILCIYTYIQCAARLTRHRAITLRTLKLSTLVLKAVLHMDFLDFLRLDFMLFGNFGDHNSCLCLMSGSFWGHFCVSYRTLLDPIGPYWDLSALAPQGGQASSGCELGRHKSTVHNPAALLHFLRPHASQRSSRVQ